VCNVGYYDKDHPQLGKPAWSRGTLKLTMIGAVHSEAAGNPSAADPINLVMKVAFTDLDEEQKFSSTINPTPTSP
jgi:hypothetical protein